MKSEELEKNKANEFFFWFVWVFGEIKQFISLLSNPSVPRWWTGTLIQLKVLIWILRSPVLHSWEIQWHSSLLNVLEMVCAWSGEYNCWSFGTTGISRQKRNSPLFIMNSSKCSFSISVRASYSSLLDTVMRVHTYTLCFMS